MAKEEKKEDKKGDKKAEDKKPEEKTEYYYARMAGENSVTQIPAKKIEPFLDLLKTPEELRDHTLVRVPQGGAVDAVDVKNSYGLIKLRLTAAGAMKRWELYRGDQKGVETDESSVQTLLRDLTSSHQIKTFPDPKTKLESLELDKPTAVLSLWIDGIAKEEKKADDKKDEAKKEDTKDSKTDDKKEAAKDDKKPQDKEPKLKTDKPTIQLSFGKADRDQGIVYVLREAGDEKTIMTLPATFIDPATRGPLAYYNRRIPTAGDDPSEALKELVLTRNGSTVKLEVTKKDNQDVWKYKEPKELQGRTASPGVIGSMLANLKHLTALRLAAENPPESDLDPLYGLKSPDVEIRLTATGKDNKPVEYVYSFGKETADKTGVFARCNKSNLIYIVNKPTVEQFRADLRDPTILSFDTAAMRKIKLTGWKGNLLKPSVVELERKEGGGWKADFDIDPSKADEFMILLKNLQVARYVTPQEAIKIDRNKFSPDLDGLLIEITLDKEKEPLRLYLDGADMEETATCSYCPRRDSKTSRRGPDILKR